MYIVDHFFLPAPGLEALRSMYKFYDLEEDLAPCHQRVKRFEDVISFDNVHSFSILSGFGYGPMQVVVKIAEGSEKNGSLKEN